MLVSEKLLQRTTLQTDDLLTCIDHTLGLELRVLTLTQGCVLTYGCRGGRNYRLYP